MFKCKALCREQDLQMRMKNIKKRCVWYACRYSSKALWNEDLTCKFILEVGMKITLTLWSIKA